jgi:hypothetical protein
MIHSSECVSGEAQTFSTKQSIVVKAAWGQRPSEIGKASSQIGFATRAESINPIAVDSKGDIYIGDSINYRIKKFDSKGGYLFELDFFKYGEKPLVQPIIPDIAVDENDNVYTVFPQRQEIVKFDHSGLLISRFNLAAVNEYLSASNIKMKFNEKRFFNNIRRMVVDGVQNIYILGGDGNLVKLNNDGRIVQVWGPHATNAMNFLFVDRSNILYIWLRSHYQRCDQSGTLIGDGLGSFENTIVPYRQDSSGNIYGFTPEKDHKNVSLAMFKITDKKLYRYPISLDDIVSTYWTIDSTGNIYYTNSTGDAFKVFKVSIAPKN